MKHTFQNKHPLITLENITIRIREIRDRFILSGTCWGIKTKQNWAALGPNGTGKTSLFSSITTDNPQQAYAIEINLSVRHRENGKSIWDIKEKRMPVLRHPCANV